MSKPLPAAGGWAFADIPPPASRPSHEDYHDPRRKGVSWSRLKTFAYGADGKAPGPDGGARDFHDLYIARTRERKPPTEAMRLGTMVDRQREAWPAPQISRLRCGVIPVENGGERGELQGEIAIRILESCDNPSAFPPLPESLNFAICGGKGATKQRQDAEAEGLRPIAQKHWAAGLDLAQRLWAEDPGAWADAPPPMVVPRKEWERAVEVFRAIAEPQTRQAEIGKSLLLDGEGWAEYLVEWTEMVTIREEDLVCPGCGGALEFERGDPGVVGGPPDAWREPVADAWFCPDCGVDFDLLPAWNEDGSIGPGIAVVEIDCRAMLDRVLVLGGCPTIVEAKTSAEPQPSGGRRWQGFPAQARKFGYVEQVAFYSRGLMKSWGLDYRPLIFFAAIGNTEPYDLFVYALSPDDFDSAEKLRRADETIDDILYAYAQRVAGLRAWASDSAMSAEIEELD